MTHLYKIPSITSDLFIYQITDTHIVYEVRSKDDGKLLEPRRKSPYSIASDNRMYFDSRDISVEQAAAIIHILN